MPAPVPRRLVAALVLVALTMGMTSTSCRSRAKPGASALHPPPPPTTTTTTLPLPEADRALAATIVLTGPDLPGLRPGDVGAGAKQDVKDALRACLGDNPLLTGDSRSNPREVDGQDFDTATTFVSSEVVLGESDQQAAASLALLRRPSVPGCLAQAAKRSFAARPVRPGVSAEGIAVSIVPLPTVGAETVGLRFSLRLASFGLSLPASLDVTVVRKGRAVAVLATGGIGPPFPEDRRGALASTLANRMP